MTFCAQIRLSAKFKQGTVARDIHGHPQGMSSFSKVTKAEITMLKELRMQSNEQKQERLLKGQRGVKMLFLNIRRC